MDLYFVLGASLAMGCVIMFFLYLILILLQCQHGDTEEDVQCPASRYD